MNERECDVLIVGGGVGGCAAAMACSSMGLKTVLTDRYDWIGGQLTSQAVPPDEHPWIERFGCTRRYRDYRNRVRAAYRQNPALAVSSRSDPELNPGGGWVSKLCHEPSIGHDVFRSMLADGVRAGHLEVLTPWSAVDAEVQGDFVRAVRLRNDQTGEERTVSAKVFLDATETGDLLPLASVEYVVGAESQRETGEPHALSGESDSQNVQGLTWCAALGFDPRGDHTIECPATYEFWSDYRPSFWPGPLLGWDTIHAHTMRLHRWTLFGADAADGIGLFEYRRIVHGAAFKDPKPRDATVVNWPQNDYLLGSILDEPPEVVERRLREARELSLCLLYWLQTEAGRPDRGAGWPGLYLDGTLTGTDDGLAMAPYIRESRRARTLFTVMEQHVSAECNPGKQRADGFPDSIGIGCYRIDLHPSASGANTIDIPALPFEIPLGCLVPSRVRNLIPACKNVGTTHITNGCFRLHPVEWNLGEAAGFLAAYSVLRNSEPQAVLADAAAVEGFQALLVSQGIELHWPDGVHPV